MREKGRKDRGPCVSRGIVVGTQRCNNKLDSQSTVGKKNGRGKEKPRRR